MTIINITILKEEVERIIGDLSYEIITQDPAEVRASYETLDFLIALKDNLRR